MFVLIILAAVWTAVLVPPMVRSRRDGRPDNSVVSFRAQLSTLERATPGTSLRSGGGSSSLSSPTNALRMSRTQVQRRRQEVLMGLGGATMLFLLLALAFGGLAIALFLVTASALGGYMYALTQLKKRAAERRTKVRVLQPVAIPAPVLALRRTASS